MLKNPRISAGLREPEPTGFVRASFGPAKGNYLMFDFETEKLIAQVEGEALFDHICAVHGPSIFYSEDGRCVSCATEDASDRARRSALANSKPVFIGFCPHHGETAFYTRPNICALCGTWRGGERIQKPANPARAAARREGLNRYLDVCAGHGETPHHVGNGKCATCFASNGFRRTRNAGPVGNARAEARRAGRSEFLAECPTHGDAPHSVAHGRCLRCYTTAGVVRVHAL